MRHRGAREQQERERGDRAYHRANLPSVSVPDQTARLAEALGSGFVVEHPLGVGGFGAVFLVTELALQRRLAVKVLSPDVVASSMAAERFEREALTVAQLSHPHIVPLHFVGGRDDFRYLAMGFVDGGTAADQLAREGPWAPSAVRRLLREVADALAHAHRRGVIHRDVKAANVLLDRESGRALLTDFGIARGFDVGLTATGLVVGTPAYLAPEQVAGEPATARSDVYALGLLGYELLTGRLPFEGDSPAAVMFKRIAEPAPALRDRRADVPPALAALVMQCLERDASDRPASAAAVVDRLDAIERSADAPHPPDAAPSMSPRGSRRRWLLVTAVGAVAIALRAVDRIPGRSATQPAPEAPSATAAAAEVTQHWWRLPAGRIRIGNDADTSQPPRLSSRPAHAVTIRAVRIAPAPATGAEVARFAGASGRAQDLPLRSDDDAPALGLTFAEATAFCAWLVPGGRLPTEEEWETAARVHGDAMLGRGWEWTSSVMRAYPGAAALPPDAARYRVIRGGAPETPPALLAPSLRGYADSAATRREVSRTGVRCAVDDPEADDRSR